MGLWDRFRQPQNKLVRRSYHVPPFDLVEDNVRLRFITVLLLSIIFLLVFSIVFTSVLKDPVLSYGTNEARQITILSNPFSSQGFLDLPIPFKSPNAPSNMHLLGRVLNSQGLGVSHKQINIVAFMTGIDPLPMTHGSSAYYMAGMHMPLTSTISPCSTTAGVPAVDQIRFQLACSVEIEPTSITTDDFGFFRVPRIVLRNGFPGTIRIVFRADVSFSDPFEIFASGRTKDISVQSPFSTLNVRNESAVLPITMGELFPYDWNVCPLDAAGNNIVSKSVYVYSYTPSQFVRQLDDVRATSSLDPYAFYSSEDMLKIYHSDLIQQKLALISTKRLTTDAVSGCLNLKNTFTVTGHTHPTQFIAVVSDGVPMVLNGNVPFRIMGPTPDSVSWQFASSALPSVTVTETVPFGIGTVRVRVSPALSGMACFLLVAGYDMESDYFNLAFNPQYYIGRQVQNNVAYTDANGMADFAAAYLDTAGDARMARLRAVCNGVYTTASVQLSVKGIASAAFFQFSRQLRNSSAGFLPLCVQHGHTDQAFSVVFVDQNKNVLPGKSGRFQLLSTANTPGAWQGPPGEAPATFVIELISGVQLVTAVFVHAAVKGQVYELVATLEDTDVVFRSGMFFSMFDCSLSSGTSIVDKLTLAQMGYYNLDVKICDPLSYSPASAKATYISSVPSQWANEIVVGEQNGPSFAVQIIDECGRPITNSSLLSTVPYFDRSSSSPMNLQSVHGCSAVSFWLTGFTVNGTSFNRGWNIPVSLVGVANVSSPVPTALTKNDIVPEWFATIAAPGPTSFAVQPTLMSKYLPTFGKQLSNVDVFLSFMYAPFFRTDVHSNYSVRVRSFVKQVTVDTVAMRRFDISTATWSVGVRISPVFAGETVTLQVVDPPSYVSYMCAFLYNAHYTYGNVTDYPLYCLNGNIIFQTVQAVTNASGVATLKFLCPPSFPGSYLVAVSTASVLASNAPTWISCPGKDVASVSFTSPVYASDGITPVANSEIFAGTMIRWNASALSSAGHPISSNDTVPPLLFAGFRHLATNRNMAVVSAMTSQPTYFINSMVPCQSFRSMACNIWMGQLIPGNYSIDLYYAPQAFPYERMIASTSATPSQQFSIHAWATVSLCRVSSDNTIYGYADGELVLVTTAGYTLVNAVSLCFKSLTNSSEKVLVSVTSAITSPSPTSAVAFPSRTICSFENTTVGQQHSCPVSVRLDSAPAGRYSVVFTNGEYTSGSLLVDIYSTAVSAEFVVGYGLEPFSVLYLNDPRALRVRALSATGLPVALKRVKLLPVFVGSDIPAKNSSTRGLLQNRGSSSYLSADLSDSGNALIPVDVSVNITQALPVSATSNDVSVFGVAQFNGFRFAAGKSGVYVIAVVIDDVLVSTSAPFVFENSVLSVELTLGTREVSVPGVQELNLRIQAWNRDGSPASNRQIDLRPSRTSCKEFTKVCLVDPSVRISDVSLVTDSRGSFFLQSAHFTGGSDGEYRIVATVAGVESEGIVVRVRNVGNIVADELDNYRLLVALVCLSVIPGLFANAGVRVWWPLLMGILNFALMLVLVIFLFQTILFNPSEHVVMTSYFGIALAGLSLATCCVLLLAFIVLFVAVIVSSRLRSQLLVSRKKQKRFEQYVTRLFKGPVRAVVHRNQESINKIVSFYSEDMIEEESRKRKRPSGGNGKRDVEMPLISSSPDRSSQRASFTGVPPSPSSPAASANRYISSSSNSSGSRAVVNEDMVKEKAKQRMLPERQLSILNKVMLFLKRCKANGVKVAWSRFVLSLRPLPNNHAYLETWRDFHYPQRFLITMGVSLVFLLVALFAAVILLLWVRYLVTVAFSYFLQYYFRADVAFSDYGAFRETNAMGQQIAKRSDENLVVSILNAIFEREDEVIQFFKDVRDYIIVSAGLAIAMTGLYIAFAILSMFRLYRERVVSARQGKWFFASESPSVNIVRSGQYTGWQLGATLVCFVILFLVLWLLIFLLCWEQVRSWLISVILAAVIAYLLGTFIYRVLLEFIIQPYVAKRDHILRRYLFALFDFLVSIAGILSGLLSSVIQLVSDFVNLVLLTIRIDLARGDKDRAFNHPGYTAYCSMFLVDMLFNNNPVFITFCYGHCVPLIRYEQNVLSSDRLQGSAIESKQYWDGERFADEVHPVSNVDIITIVKMFMDTLNMSLPKGNLGRDEQLRREELRDLARKYYYERVFIEIDQRRPFTLSIQTKRQRVRNRFWLCVILSRNPELTEHRKKALFVSRLEEVKQKYVAMAKVVLRRDDNNHSRSNVPIVHNETFTVPPAKPAARVPVGSPILRS